MPANLMLIPFPIFLGLDGLALDAGYVYFGVVNTNPITNPITVYWDKDGLTPAAQPIRTAQGFAIRSGTPAALYVLAHDCSLLVQDRNHRQVFYSQSTNVLSPVLPLNVKNFGAVGDGTTDDTAAVQAAIVAAAGAALYFPGADGYLVTDDLAFEDNSLYLGDGEGSSLLFKVSTANAATTTGKDNITFRGIKFESEGTYSSVVTFDDCTNLRFEDVVYDGQSNAGAVGSVAFRFYGCRKVTFDNSEIYDVDSGIYLDYDNAGAGVVPCDEITVAKTHFEHTVNSGTNNPTGVYMFNCKRLLVDTCVFKNIKATGGAPIAGYSVYDGDGVTESLEVVNCTTIMDHGSTARAHVMVQNSNAPNCLVQGNRFFGRAMGLTGINRMYNGGPLRGDVRILNNYSSQGGIFCGGGNTDALGVRTLTVHNNFFGKLEQNSPAIFVGVLATNYVEFASIKYNTSYCTYGAGIYIGECTFFDISDNRIMNWNTQNSAAGVYAKEAAIYAEPTVKAGRIARNRIENNPAVPGETGYPRYAIATDAAAVAVRVTDDNIIGAMTVANYVNVLPDTGTYVPTGTIVANLDALVPGTFNYARLSDTTVMVWGAPQIDPTAAGPTATQFGLSLPLASNFGAVTDAGGSGNSGAVQGEHFAIYADVANDRVTVDGSAASAANHSIYTSFTYRII